MSPREIIERASEEGVLLALSPSNCISVRGEQGVVDRWLPAIRQSKAAIIAELQRERRRAKVLTMLHDNPGTRYAIEVPEPNADPVIVSVAIRDIATFELSTPHACYDGFVLLDLIEKHTEGCDAAT